MASTMNSYRYLNRAQLSINYLHSNSTTHEFLFGALAEMIDNSRDANAKNINIYAEKNETLRGGYMLCFLDDGCGMSPNEARDVMTFGRSFKKDDTFCNDRKMIGQYGNGLKSGSMRIGNDFILLTKCNNEPMTCLLLSRTFHEEEKIDEVIVPSPSFDVKTKELCYEDEDTKEKATTELGLIYKYSPFKDHTALMKAFDTIASPSGTFVCVYTLKLNSAGHCELDFETYKYDILVKPPPAAGLAPHDNGDSGAFNDAIFIGTPAQHAINGGKGMTGSNNDTDSSSTVAHTREEYKQTLRQLVTESGEPEEKISLRSYLAILYYQNPTHLSSASASALASSVTANINVAATLDPTAHDNFNMWLRQTRLARTHWLQWLFKPRRYIFSCNKFTACAEADYQKTKKDAKIAEEIAREAESKSRDLRNRYGLCPTEKDKRMELRKINEQAKSLRQKSDILKQTSERKLKSLKDPKSLDLIFGINLYDRSKCGAFVYNQSRLTKMYQPFNNNPVSSIKNNGVVCLIDIPYEILEPTHNKQDFADEKEWKMLKGVINSHYNDYVYDILDKVSSEFKTWKEFWTYYGYEGENPKPSKDKIYLNRLAMVIPKYKQCVRCLKYRKIPFQMNAIAQHNIEMDEDTKKEEFWECSQNMDKKANRCEIPEQKIDIPLAKLRKNLPTKNTATIANNLQNIQRANRARYKSEEDESETSQEEDGRKLPASKIQNQPPTMFTRSQPNNHHNTQSTNETAEFKSPEKFSALNNCNLNGDNTAATLTDLDNALALLRRPADLMPSSETSNPPGKTALPIKNEFDGDNNAKNDTEDMDSLSYVPKPNNQLQFTKKGGHLHKRKHIEDRTFSVSSRVKSNLGTSGIALRRNEEKVEKLCETLRAILKIFTPPGYVFTAEDVAKFEIDDFIAVDTQKLKSHYEIELKKLIEKQSKKSVPSDIELEAAKAKEQLLQLRKNVFTLLRMTSPGITLENAETEEVDAFVSTCISGLSSGEI